MTPTPVTAGRDGRDRRARRELAAVLLAGLAGAGLVLLGSRQPVATVIARAPRPLPDTVTTVTAQDLRPAIAALGVAALASLAAVLATRGLLRRVTGLVTIALGGVAALLGAATVSAAAVLAVASKAGASPAGGTGAGTAAGSVTAGPAHQSAAGTIAGLGSHVQSGGPGWRVLVVAGAVLVAAAGAAAVARAGRLPAMSARYERAPGRAPAAAAPGGGGPVPASADAAAGGAGSAVRRRPESERMWESLSAGADPTVWPE